MIRCTCPHCKIILGAPPEKAGLVVCCSHCKKQLRLPDLPADIQKARAPAGESCISALARRLPVSPVPKTFRRIGHGVPRMVVAAAGLAFVALTAAAMVGMDHFWWQRSEATVLTENSQSKTRAELESEFPGPENIAANPTPPKSVSKGSPEKSASNLVSSGNKEPNPHSPPVTKIDPAQPTPEPTKFKIEATEPTNDPAKPEKSAAPDQPPALPRPSPEKGIDAPAIPLANMVDSAKIPAIDLAKLFGNLPPNKGNGPLDPPTKVLEKSAQPVNAGGTPQQPGPKNLRDTYPHPFDKIQIKLMNLSKPPGLPDPLANERQAALQKLMAYRYLAGQPHAHLKLDSEFDDCTTWAAKICEKLKKLDHNPPNPGFAQADYQKGLKGAKSSNLAAAFPAANLAISIDMWMDDSDAGNIDLLGHRRWCLNPKMGKTGFGKAGPFSAMWAIDSTHTPPPWDFVCFPAKGFMPVEYFGESYAWNVSLNPANYAIPKDDGVVVKIFPADLTGKKTGPALVLNHKSVNRGFVGSSNLCLVFRPDKSAVAAGKVYLVEIHGVTKNGAATTISYPVEFVSLAAGPANP